MDAMLANEVVRSGADVARELLENGVDAGATCITLTLDDGGRSITLVDNGHGMHRRDLRTVARPYTSGRTGTAALGVRGQALWAMARRSDSVRIRARPAASAVGNEVTLTNDGCTRSIRGIAMNVGCTVIVNLPVHLQLTSRACTDILLRAALAAPHVALRGPRFDSTDLDAQRIFSQHVRSTAYHAGQAFDDDVTIDVYAALRSKSPPFFVVINGRVVAQHVAAPFRRAVRTRMGAGADAAFLIVLKVNESVVSFAACASKDVPSYVDPALPTRLQRRAAQLVAAALAPFRAMLPSGASWAAREHGAKWRRLLKATGDRDDEDDASQEKGEITVEGQVQGSKDIISVPSALPQHVRAVGQVLDTYILAEHRHGLLLIEQHVAHERVLYERMLLALQSPASSSDTCASITISVGVDACVDEAAQRLQDLGLSVTSIDPHQNCVTIATVPRTLHDADLLTQLATHDRPQLVLAQVSCDAAVKNGRSLADVFVRDLVQDLLRCDNGAVCPHGRPIFQHIDTSQLASLFRRSWSPERFDVVPTPNGSALYGVLRNR